jgi:pilus assembly protein CpaB
VRRRLLAAVAALVLALLGALVLVAYARAADSRAMAGLATAQVLVVTAPISSGTPADQLAGSVRSELVPVKAAVPGRVRSLSTLRGQVTTVDLEPGEQLLAGRFAAPSQLRTPGTVAVPDGDQELSIQLAPQRAMGGRLAAGDEVAIFVSSKLPDGTGVTHGGLHHVLVTQVQGAVAAATAPGKAAAPANGAQSATPSQDLLITLAVTAKEGEPIVWAMENGSVWLSLEPTGADTGGTAVVSPGDIYTGVYQ